jgi:SAM-dependent methyltransferase
MDETPSLFAQPAIVDDLRDCLFYHTMDVPGAGTVEGWFDLRASVDEYLGRVDFRGKRVLEIGPASGFLTFHMERQGAEVVAVDVSEAFNWDAVPYPPAVLERWWASPSREAWEALGWTPPPPGAAGRWSMMLKIRNAFWYAHRRLRSRARVHYGSAYALPDALGAFDVAVMGAVLLHNRDPLSIIAGCAKRTRETIIIVDQYDEALDKLQIPALKLVPSADVEMVDTWWHLSPALLRQFLGILGFTRFETSIHEQPWMNERMTCFTLVARRG